MNLSSGDLQPIISNVALGPSALGQHWKLLASAHHLIKPHCKLATLSRRQKPMLPGPWYLSMSPAGQQSLQFYNEFIKWWPSANIFQCCPRATLENIGFGSPLDKASLLSCGIYVIWASGKGAEVFERTGQTMNDLCKIGTSRSSNRLKSGP